MDLQKAFLFGITVAIAVGPIALLIVHRSINNGFSSGALTGVGVALANFIYGVVGFSIGSSILKIVQAYETTLRFFSSSLLFIIALYLLVGSVKSYREPPCTFFRPGSRNDFLSGCLLTLSNPLSLAIYLGFVGQVAVPDGFSVFLMAGACCLGDLAVELGIAGAASRLRTLFRNAKIILLLNIASAAGIAYFGLARFLF